MSAEFSAMTTPAIDFHGQGILAPDCRTTLELFADKVLPRFR
jgi:hypothetical protein